VAGAWGRGRIAAKAAGTGICGAGGELAEGMTEDPRPEIVLDGVGNRSGVVGKMLV
jgi:hypothetical protein